jgi:hypothetical protein
MRTICAALMCACTLAVGAGVAAAETIEMPYGELGFTAKWASFEGEAFGTTIRCPVTLEGSFQEPGIQTATGTPVGTVNEARFGACTGGTATAAAGSLPWHVKFSSFTGLLPNIASVKMNVTDAAIATVVIGLRCTIRASEAEPLRWNTTLVSHEAVATEVDPATVIRNEGESFCAFGGPARLRGRSGPLLMQLGGQTVTMVQGPAANGPWVVSVGDSFIAGEAGRWASNTVSRPQVRIDRLGSRAYFDNANATAELIPLCHRAERRANEIAFGFNGGPRGRSLACSGARTTSQTIGTTFKPGLDLANPSSQSNQLRDFARAWREAGQPVRAVVVSIGGNDFHFAEIITSCVASFTTGVFAYCRNDPNVTRYISPTEVANNRTAIQQALRNVHTAMVNAGYLDTDYWIIVQDYESLIPPNAANIRYPEDLERWSRGGCPMYNTDIEWASTQVLPLINSTIWAAYNQLEFTNKRRMEVRDAFEGRRLCETFVGLLESAGYEWWSQNNVVNDTEWVNQIRTLEGTDLKRQESLHPNSWGYLALRNCLRLAYNNGVANSGTCLRQGGGLNQFREPIMQLVQ